MMAHEIPLAMHSKPKYDAPPPSTMVKQAPKPSKRRPGKQDKVERELPNGAPVDFGHSKKASKAKPKSQAADKSKAKTLTLPSGEKPKFTFNGDGVKGQSLPNGQKPVFNPPNTNKKSSKTGKRSQTNSTPEAGAEETYAGSSFHSSPAALNLPKPSFKTASPKARPEAAHTSPLQQQQQQQHPIQPVSQYPVFRQGGPPGPVYPVAPYTASTIPPVFATPNQNPMIYRGNQFVQPGFSYHHSPQGFINYHQSAPQHPVQHMAPAPQCNGYAMQQFASPQHHPNYPVMQPQGQKISFNDLIGQSAK
ncbi:Enhancer of mRNA-decapping protein 1 [[Candida] zeylanoides]